jgi:DNA-binding Lrp family transcriptional regulator
MDDKDSLLLTLLRRNARSSIVALARDLGLSRSATQDRLARLVASGAISGFTTIEGVGNGARQSAYLMLSFAPGRRCTEIVPQLRKVPFVSLIHSLTGPTDLLVRVDGDSIADLEKARAAVAAVPGILSVATSILLERHLG